MTETVKSLAAEIQTSVERLVQQFADAGIKKGESDSVSQNEKETLLAHLNREQGGTAGQPSKLTLQRKTRSTLSVPVTGGKSKSVNIEVRKKRTYVNRDAVEQAETEEQAKREAEEQARREAEERHNAKRKKKRNVMLKRKHNVTQKQSVTPKIKQDVKQLKKLSAKQRK